MNHCNRADSTFQDLVLRKRLKLFSIPHDFDLLLYEFFQTDMYGHGFSLEECVDLIRNLNRLVKHLISLLDGEKDTLLITSDHGNLEDSLTPMHTTNPVPLIAWGRDSGKLRQQVENLSEISPAIVDFFHKKCLKV